MLKRKYDKRISEFLKSKEKKSVLLIDGVRQAGKSTSVRENCKKLGLPLVEINFYFHPEHIERLERCKTANEIIDVVRLYNENGTFVPHKTVIFFDEIQLFPRLLEKAKMLVEEGSYTYVFSGSLLGITIRNIADIGVGYVDILQFYPLTFDEFVANVSNYGEELNQACRQALRELKPLRDDFHHVLIDLFYRYLAVGGMPECVDSYVKTKLVSDTFPIKKKILADYKADFSKYESENRRLHLISLYESVPAFLLKENKRFTISYHSAFRTFDDIEDDYLFLTHSGVALPVTRADELKSPIRLVTDPTYFKLYLSDVGLLAERYPVASIQSLLDHDGTINNGAMMENYVAQTLMSNGFELHYYRVRSVGEVDFVIETSDKIIPVEVKSGKGYRSHRALDNALAKYPCPISYVVSDKPLEVAGNIVYLPVYCLPFLKKEEEVSLKETPLPEIHL
ncbi:MAG: ATP-binding protein [Bacilli bacterium]|nr:ATP-binding protein [Bacilli bacterium]